MLPKNIKETLIYRNFSEDSIVQYFDLSLQKYVFNIDTFYYSIMLDKEIDNFQIKYDYFITILKSNLKNQCSSTAIAYGINEKLYQNGFQFGIYKYDLELPEQAMYFVASETFNEDTPHIIVQIRSYLLWLHGVRAAYQITYDIIKEILDKFHLQVLQVVENRIDYAWHTNAVQNVNHFFDIKTQRKMRVGRLRDFDFHGKFLGDDDHEVDYLRYGRLKSNRVIFRAYLKSKEVVEMGYKPWFYQIWLDNKLINQFDKYCFEETFKNGKWEYLNKARIKFFLDHAQEIDPVLKTKCEHMVLFESDHDKIRDLADMLVPDVTKILNFEYMTKRKFYQSIEKMNFSNRTGIDKSVQIIFDSMKLYTDYLTNDTIRFVDRSTNDRKERCDYSYFWKRLRQAPINGVPVLPDDVELVRKYNEEINKENVKSRVLRSTAVYNILSGKIHSDIAADNEELINDLNDNDLFDYTIYKKKKTRQMKLDKPE